MSYFFVPLASFSELLLAKLGSKNNNLEDIWSTFLKVNVFPIIKPTVDWVKV